MSAELTLNKASGEKVANELAMYILLVSFSMLFGTMFLGLAVYRLTAPMWPPMGISKLPLFWPGVSTVFIILSSIFYVKAEKKLGNTSRIWILFTIFSGLGFLLSQWNLWASLKSVGIFQSSGIYGSLVYVFTWVHVAHILAGLVLLIYAYTILKKEFSPAIVESKIKNIGKFWHFLGIVWLVIYLTIFIL